MLVSGSQGQNCSTWSLLDLPIYCPTLSLQQHHGGWPFREMFLFFFNLKRKKKGSKLWSKSQVMSGEAWEGKQYRLLMGSLASQGQGTGKSRPESTAVQSKGKIASVWLGITLKINKLEQKQKVHFFKTKCICSLHRAVPCWQESYTAISLSSTLTHSIKIRNSTKLPLWLSSGLRTEMLL